jgi:hypothetical protein
VEKGIPQDAPIQDNIPVVNEIFLYQSIYDEQLAPTEHFPAIVLQPLFEKNQIYNLKVEGVIKSLRKKFSTSLAELLALCIRQSVRFSSFSDLVRTEIPHKKMQLDPPPHPIDKLLEELHPIDRTFSPIQLQGSLPFHLPF